jgi:hypothetical protein
MEVDCKEELVLFPELRFCTLAVDMSPLPTVGTVITQ